MKLFWFFLRRVFARKPLLPLAMILLLLMANYTTFSACRTLVSTQEGYEEANRLNAPGTYIANLDPNSDIDVDHITNQAIQGVYGTLAYDYSYGLYTDGYSINLPNQHHMETSVSYMNATYSTLNGFKSTEGSGLNFSYSADSAAPITVLVGEGLAEDYPIGSTFKIHDPALERTVELRVAGILAKNSAHSNLYALDSKQYYNFSVVVPVNESFIQNASSAFKINGLMDLVITDADRASVSSLVTYVSNRIGVKLNFYSQLDNSEYYRGSSRTRV